MATKTATRAAPATKTPQPASTGPTKAQRAAEHQGRAAREEPAEKPLPPKASVPATAKTSVPAGYGSQDVVPAHMRADMDMGKESIGKDDMDIPRLKLMQGLSPELQEYNDLRAGNFLHTAGETILAEAFRAVPIFMDRQYILWNPRDAGGGILARAADGIHWSPGAGDCKVKLDKKDGGHEVTWRLAKTVQQSGLANWGTMNPNDPNSPPAATLMYNFVLAFPDMPDLMPAVLTFQRSSIKMGRRLNTKLKTVRAPLFGCVFQFSSFQDKNGAGQQFFNVQAQGAGMVEDPELYEQYKAMHMSLRETGLNIKDVETIGEEQSEVPSDDGKEEAGAHNNY